MAGNDPPYLSVGTEVSAKYRGAFCEAKVKIIVKKVKCKVLLKEAQTSIIVTDEAVRGPLKMGAMVEVNHPESGQAVEATITKMTDSSMYTVVFDDGDERTLRRTQLCLKGDKHFIESETLDNLPLSNPEHFGTPVMGNKKSKGRFSTGNDEDTEDTSSDESESKRVTYKGKNLELLRKIMLMEVGEKKKLTIPVLVVLPDAHQTELKTKDHLLVKSFKDGKFLSVHRKDLKEFSREYALKNEEKPVKAAMEKALMFHDNQDLPSGWDIEELLGIDEDECSDEEESSDDEQTEEKDRFVAQLYKFMDDRGTPINKAPCLGNKDLNLYRLFKVVQNIGGYNRVTNQLKWRYVYGKMGLPPSNQASHQIKNAYKKYLHAFEDFYRKLGCTMGTISRPGRSRNNSGRGMMAFRGQNKDVKKEDEQGKESDKEDKKLLDEFKRIVDEEDVDDESKDMEDVRSKSPPKRERLTRKDLMKEEKDKREDSKNRKSEKDDEIKKTAKKDGLKKESKKDEPKKDNKKEENKKENKKDELEKDEPKMEIKKEEIKKENKKEEVVSKKGRPAKKEKEELKDKKDEQKDKAESGDENEENSEQGEQKKIVRRRSMRKDEIKIEPMDVEDNRTNDSPEKEVKTKPKAAGKKEEKKDDIDDIPGKEVKTKLKAAGKKEEKKDDINDSPEKEVKTKPKAAGKKEEKKEDKNDSPEKEVKTKPKAAGKKEQKKDDIKQPKVVTKKDGKKDDDKNGKDTPAKKLKAEEKTFIPQPEEDKKKAKVDVKDTIKKSNSGEDNVEANSVEDIKPSNRTSKEHPYGTKLKVLYGRGKNQKIYEAKIKESSREGGLQYLVHYAGWNNRYDEWIKPERIVRVVDKPDKSDTKPAKAVQKSPKLQQATNRVRSRSITPKGLVSSVNSVNSNSTESIDSGVKEHLSSENRPTPVSQVRQNQESRISSKPIVNVASSVSSSVINVHQQPTVNLKAMSVNALQSHINPDNKSVTMATTVSLATANSSGVPSQPSLVPDIPVTAAAVKSKTGSDIPQVTNFQPSRQGMDVHLTKSKSPSTKTKPRSTRSNSTDFTVLDGLPPKQRKTKRSVGAPGQSDNNSTGSESEDNNQSDTDVELGNEDTIDDKVDDISAESNKNFTLECLDKSLDKIPSESPSKDSEKSDDSIRDDMPKLSPIPDPAPILDSENSPTSSFKDKSKEDKKFDKMAKISLVKLDASPVACKEGERKIGSEISDIIHRKIEAEVSKQSASDKVQDAESVADTTSKVQENKAQNDVDEFVKSPPKLHTSPKDEKPVLKKEAAPVIDDRFEFKDDSDEDYPLPDLRAEICLEKERIKLECENEKKKEKSKKLVKEKKEVKETKRMRTLAERKIGPPNLVYVEYGFYEPPNKKPKEETEKQAKDVLSSLSKFEDSYSSSESQDTKNSDYLDVKEENETEKKKAKKKVKKKKDVGESSAESEFDSKKELKGAKMKGDKSATKSKAKKNKDLGNDSVQDLNKKRGGFDSASFCMDKVSDNELGQSHLSENKSVIHCEPSNSEQVQSSSTVEVTMDNSANVSDNKCDTKVEVSSSLLLDNTPPTTPEHQMEDSSCSSQEKSHEPIKLPEMSHLHEQQYGGESPAGNASPSSNDGSVGSGNVACSESSSNDMSINSSAAKRRRESEEPTPSKKKRKGRHKSFDKKVSKQPGSDSDEAYNTDHRFSPEPVHSLGRRTHSPRPSKVNLNLEEGQYLEGEQRISFLMEKIQEIRKVYMNLKSEVATIDRRRKRARRRERESAHSSSAAEGECVR